MAWIAKDRRAQQVKEGAPLLTDELKKHLAEKYIPRYPTRRAALLPALHHIQHAFGHIPPQALAEVAEFLEISPAEALDTASFYEEYWLKPKGKYLIQVCRSLACEICGSRRLTDHIQDKLGIQVGQTTPDGKFTLVEVECLGSCGTAPAVLVNEVLHEDLTAQSLDQVLDNLPDNPADYRDPSVAWHETHR
jgi:NADH-quinone oxidoreductase E subunit